jgi:chromosome segregation ATPase
LFEAEQYRTRAEEGACEAADSHATMFAAQHGLHVAAAQHEVISVRGEMEAAIAECHTRLHGMEDERDARQAALCTAQREINQLRSEIRDAASEIEARLHSSNAGRDTAEGQRDALQSALSASQGELDAVHDELQDALGEMEARLHASRASLVETQG